VIVLTLRRSYRACRFRRGIGEFKANLQLEIKAARKL